MSSCKGPRSYSRCRGEKKDEFEVAAINHLEENKGATGQVADSLKVLMEDSPRGSTAQVANFSKVDMAKSQEGPSLSFLSLGAKEQLAGSLKVASEKPPEADSLEVVKEETSEGASLQAADSLEVVIEESPEDASGQEADSMEVVKEETPEGAFERVDTTCEVALEDGGMAEGVNMGIANGRDTSRHLNGSKTVVVIDLDSDEDLHPEQHEPERVAHSTPVAAMDVTMAPTHGAPGAMNGASAPTLRRALMRARNGTTAPIDRVPALAALHALQSMNPPGENEPLWNYVDPQGEARGAFTMRHLRQWHRDRFFTPDFRVWRLGQTQKDSILLTEAMGLNFSS